MFMIRKNNLFWLVALLSSGLNLTAGCHQPVPGPVAVEVKEVRCETCKKWSESCADCKAKFKAESKRAQASINEGAAKLKGNAQAAGEKVADKLGRAKDRVGEVSRDAWRHAKHAGEDVAEEGKKAASDAKK